MDYSTTCVYRLIHFYLLNLHRWFVINTPSSIKIIFEAMNNSLMSKTNNYFHFISEKITMYNTDELERFKNVFLFLINKKCLQKSKSSRDMIRFRLQENSPR